MNGTPRALVLPLALLAAACASTPEAPTPSGGGTGGGESAADASTGGGGSAAPASGAGTSAPAGAFRDVAEEGQYYGRIADLASRWAALLAEPGEVARAEARSLETAIAREVVRHMDAVLLQAEKGTNPRWRRAAARGLGFVVHERATPVLEGLLGETDARLLVDVLVSLARRAAAETSREAEDRCVALLSHADADVRSNAALCLARVMRARERLGVPLLSPADRVPGVEAALLAALFDPADAFVRGNAAQALGVLAGPSCEDALQNGLRDADVFVRVSSVQALSRVGTARSVPPILDAMGLAREASVRQAAALALGAIAEREGRQPPLSDLGTDATKWRAWWGR